MIRALNRSRSGGFRRFPTATARPRALALLLAGLLSAAGAHAQNDKARPVTLAEVQSQTLASETRLLGTTEAPRRSPVSPRVEGLVTEVFVDVGREVKKGDPILALDARLAELDLDAAKAREAEAQARLRDAVRVRNELKRLEKGRHASQTQIDSAIAQVEINNAALRGVRAQIARLEEVLARHRLAAPFDGMVVEKNVEAGQWVQRDDAAVTLLGLDTIRLRASVPQGDFARIAVGSEARVQFDARPGEELTGKVVARVAAGDPRTRTFPLLIDLPNPDHTLAPGMSARVRVELAGTRAQVLTVPRDAVIALSDGSRQVWRVTGSEQAGYQVNPVRIETGRADADRLELRAGDLAAGDRIVLLGNENLKPGQKVQPRETTAGTTAPVATR